ncbi:MAG: hypothetical protein IKY80_04475, partial [Alistipes sp.]|nr:hypothetical protein [Alistipes sp.]
FAILKRSSHIGYLFCYYFLAGCKITKIIAIKQLHPKILSLRIVVKWQKITIFVEIKSHQQ